MWFLNGSRKYTNQINKKITLHNNYNFCTIKKTHLSRYCLFPSYADACLNQQFHTVLSLSSVGFSFALGRQRTTDPSPETQRSTLICSGRPLRHCQSGSGGGGMARGGPLAGRVKQYFFLRTFFCKQEST
jgi:hypothetical protein